MKKEESEKFINDKLIEFSYKESTAKIYKIWLDKFIKFNKSENIKKIKFDGIENFISFLKNETEYSISSIRQAISALEFLYNTALKNNYQFKKIKINRPVQSTPITISKSEIKFILNSIKNLKQRIAIALIYSCGLTPAELVSLKIKDLNKSKKTLKIRKEGGFYRESNVGNSLINAIIVYLENYNPKKYLFENDKTNAPYSKESLRNAFNKVRVYLENGERYTLQHLKNSYVKHLVDEGFQLTDVLNHIGLKNYEVYSRIEGLHTPIRFSPIDSLNNQKDKSKLKTKITNEQAENIVFTDSQTKILLENNPNIIKSFIENDITNLDITAIGYRKKQLDKFEKLLNDPSYFEAELKRLNNTSKEHLWQTFFEKNTWIFGYGLNFVFTSNLDEKKIEQVVSGNTFNNFGKRVDGLLKTRGLISSFCFVEIKNHDTPLLENKPYRSDCWNTSRELSGAVSQIQKTVQKSLNSFSTKTVIKDSEGNPTEETIFLYKPKSFLIIGCLSEFIVDSGVNESKYSSFEIFRQNTNSPEIITYDELFERAKHLIMNDTKK